jgi:hypothetical protein
MPIAQKMRHHHLTYDDKALTFLSDDPVCSSQGCQYTHLWGDGSENKYPKEFYPNREEVKKDAITHYPVGGLDADIKSTIASEKLAAENASEDSSFAKGAEDYVWHADHPKFY